MKNQHTQFFADVDASTVDSCPDSNANILHLLSDATIVPCNAGIDPDLEAELEADMALSSTAQTQEAPTITDAFQEGATDPFLGAPEPCAEFCSASQPYLPVPMYNNPWTTTEDAHLMNFRAAHPSHSWCAFASLWNSQGISIPHREVSDLFIRHSQLSSQQTLSARDHMLIWVLHNSSMPSSWSEISTLLAQRGKTIDIATVKEACQRWGRLIGLGASHGFADPQPDPVVIEGEWEQSNHRHFETMAMQVDRERELVLVMYDEKEMSVGEIADHYWVRGVRWEEECIREVIEESDMDGPRVKLGFERMGT